jgi:tRNA threonylcarbamoyladenosine biosynthesis protein TsaB
MLILTFRTDKPEAEIGLYEDDKQLAYQTWTAHRELGRTIHLKIDELLKSQNKSWQDVQGIVGFKGPGSFTGLRIGLSVANALAYANQIPVVATEGDDWLQQGLTKLVAGQNETIALPEYGTEAFTTKPRK